MALLIISAALLVVWVIRFFEADTAHWSRGDWGLFVFQGVLIGAMVGIYAVRVIRIRRRRSRPE